MATNIKTTTSKLTTKPAGGTATTNNPKHSFLKLHKEGTCQCGAITIRTYTDPLLVVNCHCSKCRAFNPSKPYNSTTLYWKFAVDIIINTTTTGSEDINDDAIDFIETSAQFNTVGLLRGRCSKCHEPVIDIGNLGILKLFTCPSASLLDLKPTANMYYNSGLKQTTEGLTTYHSDFTTGLFILPQMLYKSIPQLIWYTYNLVWEKVLSSFHDVDHDDKND